MTASLVFAPLPSSGLLAHGISLAASVTRLRFQSQGAQSGSRASKPSGKARHCFLCRGDPYYHIFQLIHAARPCFLLPSHCHLDVPVQLPKNPFFLLHEYAKALGNSRSQTWGPCCNLNHTPNGSRDPQTQSPQTRLKIPTATTSTNSSSPSILFSFITHFTRFIIIQCEWDHPAPLCTPEPYRRRSNTPHPSLSRLPQSRLNLSPLQIIIKQYTRSLSVNNRKQDLSPWNLILDHKNCSIRLFSASPLFTLLGISKTHHGCVLGFLATMGEDVLRKSCSLIIGVSILIILPLKVLGASIVSSPCVVGFPVS